MLPIIFSGIAAIGSICAAAMAYWQWDEMSRGFAVERAYLLNGGFSGYHGSPPTTGAQVTFSFTNFGKTPAEYRSAWARCEYSLSGPSKIHRNIEIPRFTDQYGLVPPGVMVEPEKSIGPFPADLDASTSQIEQAHVGNGRIYCQGLIIYDDVRNNPHMTRVCFVFNFGANAFILCPERGANYHD
jgi:hypothetical protein